MTEIFSLFKNGQGPVFIGKKCYLKMIPKLPFLAGMIMIVRMRIPDKECHASESWHPVLRCALIHNLFIIIANLDAS